HGRSGGKDSRRLHHRCGQSYRRGLRGGPGGARKLRCRGRAGASNIPRRGARGRHRPESDRPTRSPGADARADGGQDPRPRRGDRVAQKSSQGGLAHVIPKDTMTVKEASTYLSMDADALKLLAVERRIPAIEQDGQWLFSKKSID